MKLRGPFRVVEGRSSDPDEAPVQDVEEDERGGEEDAASPVDPLGYLLGRHRREAGVVGRGAGGGHRYHQVRVVGVRLRTRVGVVANGIHGVHGQSVAVVLKQEVVPGARLKTPSSGMLHRLVESYLRFRGP